MPHIPPKGLMSNLTTPLQKAGRIRGFAAYYVDMVVAIMPIMCLMEILGLIFPSDSPRFGYLIITLMIVWSMIVLYLIIIAAKSPGRYLLRIKSINEKSLTVPTFKQMLSFATGFFLDANPEKILVVIDQEKKTSLLKRICLALLVFAIFYFIIMILAALSSRNTGLYQTAINYIKTNRIGEMEHGSPVRPSFFPRAVAMQTDKGEVEVKSNWPHYSGMINLNLIRKDGKWQVVDYQISDAKSFSWPRYQYNYRRQSHSSEEVNPLSVGVIGFFMIWFSGFVLWLYSIYLLIKIYLRREKASVIELAALKRKLVYVIFIFLGLGILGMLWMHFVKWQTCPK